MHARRRDRSGRAVEPYLPLLLAPFVGLLLSLVVAVVAPDKGWPPLQERIGMAGAAVAIALCTVPASPVGPAAWANCLLGWGLLPLAWIDIRHFRLPDVLTLPLLLLGLGGTHLLEPWLLTDHAIAAIAGYAALRLIGWAYAAWRGQEGLGQGDAKLLAVGGAWVGIEGLSWVVLLAALAGIAWAGLLAARGAPLTARTRLPFGPFLALGIWLVRLLQDGY